MAQNSPCKGQVAVARAPVLHVRINRLGYMASGLQIRPSVQAPLSALPHPQRPALRLPEVLLLAPVVAVPCPARARIEVPRFQRVSPWR